MCFSRPLVAALVLLALPALAHAQEWSQAGQFTRTVNCVYFLPTPGAPVIGFTGTGDFESGHGEIFRTADSGNTWTKTDFHPSAEESVTDILFRDKKVGWATTLTARNDRGHVYYTSDGGQRWIQTSASPGVYLGLGYSPSSHLLFAARGGTTATASSDDGATWRTCLNATVTSFSFVDDSIGFASGSHRFSPMGSTFAITRDGGRTWQFSTLNKECYQPAMLPGSHEIFAVDDQSGALYTSRDLGQTWDTIYRFSDARDWMSGCIRANKCGRLYAQSGYSNAIGLVVSEDRGRSWRDLRPAALARPLTNTIDTRFFAQGDVVYTARHAETTGSLHTLYRYRRTETAGGAPFAMQRSVIMRSAGCEYIDTVISIAYPNDCATATLIQASCNDSLHFQILDQSLPKRLSNVTPIRIAFLPTDADTIRSFLALAYQIGDATIADTVWLTGYLNEGATLTRLQLLASPRTAPILAGDTLTLNIVLRDTISQSMALDSLECTVSFDGDLLAALPTVAHVNWPLTSATKRANSVTICVAAPGQVAPAGAIVAQLPLRVMLSLDTIARVRLEKVLWYGASFPGCPMQEGSLLSLRVSREAAACSDPALLAFMQQSSATLQVDVEGNTVQATIGVPAETSCKTTIVNTMGEQLLSSTSTIASGTHSLRFTKPMTPGVYYFVLEAGRSRLTRSFIVD